MLRRDSDSRRDSIRPALVFTDLDGTLLRGDGSVSPFSRRVLARCADQGVAVVPVTGRSWVAALAALQWLAASTPIVCLNGSFSCDLRTGVVNGERPIDAAILRTLLLALAARNVPVVVDANDRKFGSPGSEGLKRLLPPGPWRRFVEIDDIPSRAYTVIASSEALADVTDVVAGLPGLRCVQSSEHCLVITEARATKAAAVRQLCSRLGVSPASAIAFGDAENDLEMLSFVGHGVAMANGAAAVRADARYVTQFSNEEDGVARYLTEELHLGVSS